MTSSPGTSWFQYLRVGERREGDSLAFPTSQATLIFQIHDRFLGAGDALQFEENCLSFCQGIYEFS